jgi:hypothetical protein
MGSEGILENHTDFGSASDQFGFTLTSCPKSGAVSARFTGGRIEVSVPHETLNHWVGIYAEQQTKGEDALTIAIEKDFRCLDRSRAEEDEKDAFPHPLTKRQSL